MGITSLDRLAKVKEWQVKYPERIRAHQLVQMALRSGELQKQPCEVCGSEKSDAHHEDYSKPLDGMWFCRKHHLRHHAEKLRGPVSWKVCRRCQIPKAFVEFSPTKKYLDGLHSYCLECEAEKVRGYTTLKN
jgi:hypothetical protein